MPGCWASGVGRSPSPSRPSMKQAAGANCPFSAGAGGACVGIRHQPHSARSCELALHAMGAARGCRGGGAGLLPWSRASMVGRSPSPSRPSMGQAADDAARFSWAPAVRPWGPVTNPTVRALERWLCTLCRRHKGPRGGRPVAWLWGVRGTALSFPQPPVHGASGRCPLPVFCGHGGCGRGDPSPTLQLALLRAGFTRCGGGTWAP